MARKCWHSIFHDCNKQKSDWRIPHYLLHRHCVACSACRRKMLLGRVCMKRFACWGAHQFREESFYGSPCGAVSVSVVRGVSNYYCCAEGSRLRETTALAFHVVCPQPPTARLCQPGAPQRCPSAQLHASRVWTASLKWFSVPMKLLPAYQA